MVMQPDFIEDLDLSQVVIPEAATPNRNNNVMWTTKVHLNSKTTQSPIGQMSFWARVIYVITPGKDKTAETHKDSNRNCDVIIEPSQEKFIAQCNLLNEVAIKHAIEHKDTYWPGAELTDSQVRKKHRPLIVPTKDGDKMVFRCKLRPPLRKNKEKKLVKNPRATIMTRVIGEEDAPTPTSIDEVHATPDTRDFVQNICDFVCFYRSDAFFGINVYVPQGWHKTEEHASFTRKVRNFNKRKSPETTSSSSSSSSSSIQGQDSPVTKRASVENISAQNDGGVGGQENEHDYDDDSDDVDDQY